jgi:hypothetical protein
VAVRGGVGPIAAVTVGGGASGGGSMERVWTKKWEF